LRFTHLELFWVRILISCAPVVGVLNFFSWSSSSFLRKGYAGNVTPVRVLVLMLITSFLPSVKGLEFLLFDVDVESLLQSQWGVLGLCALREAGLLASAD
jgi:hypothetical protein